MNELKRFSKWIKESIDNRFIFQNHGEFCIVCDGHKAFKIRLNFKPYIDEIKRQTFQSLEKDFVITERQIDFRKMPDLLQYFKYEHECTPTKLHYEYGCTGRGRKKKARIFMLPNELVFVDEEYANLIDSYGYKCYGTSNVGQGKSIRRKLIYQDR